MPSKSMPENASPIDVNASGSMSTIQFGRSGGRTTSSRGAAGGAGGTGGSGATGIACDVRVRGGRRGRTVCAAATCAATIVNTTARRVLLMGSTLTLTFTDIRAHDADFEQ